MSSTQIARAWLAGMIEADGYIGVHVRKNGRSRFKVAVEMVDEDVVQHCHTVTGLGNMFVYDRNPEKWKRTYKWQIQATEDVVVFLTLLKPYLISQRKRNQVDVVFEKYECMKK